MTTYVTSDPHLGHNKDFVWAARGYTSSVEHDAAFVAAWNATVKPEDEVYILGDLVVGEKERAYESLRQLAPATIHIILGNHDTDNKVAAYREIFGARLASVSYATVVKCGKQSIYLSHYPTVTANMDDGTKPFHSLTLGFHGHTHSKEAFYGGSPLCLNVGLDAHHRLLTLEEAVAMCRRRYDADRKSVLAK